MTSRRIDWNRMLAEGFLIVFSILIALGVQAWWEGRGSRTAEADAIAQLKLDFAGYLKMIDSEIDLHTVRAATASELLTMTGPNAQGPYLDFDESLDIVGAVNPITFPPGMLETLMETTGLALIRDPAVQQALTKWQYNKNAVVGIGDFTFSEAVKWLDYMKVRFPIRTDGVGHFSRDPTQMLRDVEFENHISQQRFASDALIGWMGALRGSAEEVLTALEDG